ncbi:MAG TPA: hypothetical protein VGM01_03765 [Ktedonobacteraceae bacterium]
MAKYLSQFDIDVYIYIAEGDKEYQYNPLEEMRIHQHIWQNFSEIALSLERLKLEVGLSIKEAKRVADARLTADFTSLADIESIDKIAKVSVNKIKKFVATHNMTELVNIPEEKPTSTDKNGSPQRSLKKKKKSSVNPDIIANALFVL